MERSLSEAPVPLAAVRSWHDANPCPQTDTAPPSSPSPSSSTPHFRVDKALNRKLALWSGAIWRLQVGAVANSTNEALNDTSGLCRRLMDAAGPQIWVECRAAGSCRTGEAVLTRGCRLPASYIIHTVGPRYNLRYVNAAENALHMCYRNTLSVAKEEKIRSVALSCIYTRRKGYPRDEAAHIAARTVRRFLEHYSDDFDCVVLCVDSLEDQMIYESVLPLYFPRTHDDELKQATRLAHRALGDAFGEPVIEERKIRIRPLGSGDNQAEHETDDIDNDDGGDSTDDEETAIQDFREMSVDPDSERLARLRQLQDEREKRAAQAAAKSSTTTNGASAALRSYEAALSTAKREDFADLRALRFLYSAGVDRAGAPVIVYEGARLPVDAVDLDRVALFVVQSMEAVVGGSFSVLYVHAGVTGENQPTGAWLRRLFRLFSTQHQANLRFVYVLEPTLWLKLLVLVARGFATNDFYRKIVYLASERELDHVADSLALPPHIYTKRSPPAAAEPTPKLDGGAAESSASDAAVASDDTKREAVL
ncbi:hypothetical protein PybrP1_005149 [[Pythium] brassicae (nom. inval.)]|nr:hypothetical protein PybrP1_005149 [[Pythium] brassicae (nom. inval.)]